MKFVVLIGLLIVFSVVTCERITQPTISKAVVELVPEAVMVTEAWFSVKTERPDAGLTVALERDGKEILRLAGLKDTIVADSGLQSGHGYTYRLRLYRSGKVVGPTPPVSITTMDTTSHNFQWEVVEFPSPFGSGALYDVAIIDVNNIWVVGEIYADSAQPWLRYNAVHWNGKKWELKRITVKFRNSFITPPGEGIFAFAENNIWVTLGGAPAHWDGQSWKLYHLWDMGVLEADDGGVTGIWGNSQEDIYFAGRGGTVVHYDGRNWHRIESGTDLPIQDIWGSLDPVTNKPVIICVASSIQTNDGRKLLLIENGKQVKSLPVSGLSWSIKTIWFKAGKTYYIGGDGIYISKDIPRKWKRRKDFPRLYKHRIRGVDINDVMVVGSYGLLAHYNGLSWKFYNDNSLPLAAYRGVAVTSKRIVAVGYLGANAIITVGVR